MKLTRKHWLLWSRLSTCSRRAIIKTRHRYSKKRHGAPYVYNPRGDLLVNLVREGYATNVEDARRQLFELRFGMLSFMYDPDKAKELAYNCRIN